MSLYADLPGNPRVMGTVDQILRDEKGNPVAIVPRTILQDKEVQETQGMLRVCEFLDRETLHTLFERHPRMWVRTSDEIERVVEVVGHEIFEILQVGAGKVVGTGWRPVMSK